MRDYLADLHARRHPSTLGRKLAYWNGYTPEQAIGLYPTDGTTTDFVYGELGIAAYTFELGTAFTMIAGLLNILAIYDAWGGPVFLETAKKDEEEDEDEKKEDDQQDTKDKAAPGSDVSGTVDLGDRDRTGPTNRGHTHH